MPTGYTSVPQNLSSVLPCLIADIEKIKKQYIRSDKVLFYDACSFQYHARLDYDRRAKLIQYFKALNTDIYITRCVLTELAGEKHFLDNGVITYIQEMNLCGLRVVLFDEEFISDILDLCFSTNEVINEKIKYSVRSMKCDTTVRTILSGDSVLSGELLKDGPVSAPDIASRFFTKMRNRKSHKDNMGKELIGICAAALSYIPGTGKEKIHVLTDDRHAAELIDSVIKKAKKYNDGAALVLYSSPKLAQHMYNARLITDAADIASIAAKGTPARVKVLVQPPYGIDKEEQTCTAADLAGQIMSTNGPIIIF